MNISLLPKAGGPAVGNLYGWALGFLAEGKVKEEPSFIITSDDYYAKVAATMPTALNGGRFSITLDAVTDEDYRKIAGCKAAVLYLYWRDVNADLLGKVANVAGLIGLGSGPSAASLKPAHVATFAYSVSRKSGQKAIETTLDGRDNAYDRLARAHAPQACFPNLATALKALASAADVEIIPQPTADTLLGQALEEGDERTDAAVFNQTCASALETIAKRIAAGSLVNPTIPQLREDAPSIILFRQGAVYVGRRPIPFPQGGAPKSLDLDGGLVEVSRQAHADKSAIPSWNLLCRGRPDIQVGDVVRFEPPPEEQKLDRSSVGAALLGAVAGPAASLFKSALGGEEQTSAVVTAVVHNLSRNGGFTTQVTGLEIPKTPTDTPWEPFHSSADQPRAVRRGSGGDPATAVARQVRDLARAALGRLRFPVVAEVRSSTSKGTSIEPPAGTVTVFEGIGGDTVQAFASRRMPIRRKGGAERRNVPTLTPFAWGRCGLAVPRYPGMRVMLSFGSGDSHDPIEIGALWGPGAERMETEPGDWWLKLPVDAPTSALDGKDEKDHFPSGKVVNDLTDKSGNRVIEVGKLTIRVGDPPVITARPKPNPKAAVSIEHSDGLGSITIDQGGKIKIKGLSIEIDAGAGNVKISAGTVDVAVTGQMKVGS